MPDVSLQRVLRSEEVPSPAATGGQERLRELATAGTIVLPDLREVDVDGQAVLLTRLQSGEVIAFSAYCPHQGTSLRHANIDRGLVRCEQHKYLYDPRTGQNILPTCDASPRALERLKPGYLPTYRVEEKDGWVWVANRPNPPPVGEPAPVLEMHPGASAPAAQAGDVPEEDPGERAPETVEVGLGDEFELDLPTRPHPGHLWRVAVDGEAVEVVGQRLDQQADGMHYLVQLVARTPGTAEASCVYAKPWDADTAARDSRTFVVHVREG